MSGQDGKGVSSLDQIRRFFEPESVAIIGASRNPGKFGHMIVRNLVTWGYPGQLWVVNPYTSQLLGVRSYPSLSQVPGRVDLAVVALPAAQVPQALRECAEKGVKGAILIASGFGEAGEEGRCREQAVMAIARGAGMRLLGPNTTGILNPAHRFTSTWNPVPQTRRGPVAFIAQTGMFAGVMLACILSQEHFGVSKVAGLGNKLDIAEPEVLEYLEQDPETRVVMMYMEGVKEGRRFLEVASRVNRRKPLILLKGGRTEAGARATLSHTGSLADRDEVVEGALRQAGILRARDLEEMMDLAKALAFQPQPSGPRTGVVSMSGGSAVMLTDSLVECGLVLAEVAPETLAVLQRQVPEWARVGHPLDLEPLAERVGRVAAYLQGLELVLTDPAVDGCLLSISAIDEEARLVAEVPPLWRRYGKPLSVHIMGEGGLYQEMTAGLEREGIPVFFNPRRAARSLAALWHYRRMASRDGSL